MRIFRKKQWHVSWVIKIPGYDLSYGDACIDCGSSPKTVEDIKLLRELLAEETSEAAGTQVLPSQVHITSLTRL